MKFFFLILSCVAEQKLKFTESDRLLVQIQAYLDNVFDVGALLEDAEAKNALLEHMEELQEHNTQVHTHTHTHTHTLHKNTQTDTSESCVSVSQLNNRLEENEKEAMEKVSDLEKKLIQTTKEVELLKVEYTKCLSFSVWNDVCFLMFPNVP